MGHGKYCSCYFTSINLIYYL
jgi:hypothetical protein